MQEIKLPNSNIKITYNDECLKIIKYLPECHPSICVLDIGSLNNDYKKMVHSAVVKKLRPYYWFEETSSPMAPNYSYCYRNLPIEIRNELIEHLQYFDANM